MHLLIDGYSSDTQKIQDANVLRQFLEEYPSTLGMTRLCNPVLLNYEAPNPEDSGLSGFIIIAESHLSIHTFPRRNYINIDIFSCKSFDSERVLQDVKKIFALRQVKSWIVNRGLEYYDPQMAMPKMVAEIPQGPGTHRDV